MEWDPTGYTIRVGTNGAPPIEYAGDHSFGGRAYTPPNHRISLGCYPRAETFPRGIWRNVKVKELR